MNVVVFVLVDVCTEVRTGPLDVGGALGVLVRRALLVKLLLVLRKHIFFAEERLAIVVLSLVVVTLKQPDNRHLFAQTPECNRIVP